MMDAPQPANAMSSVVILLFAAFWRMSCRVAEAPPVTEVAADGSADGSADTKSNMVADIPESSPPEVSKSSPTGRTERGGEGGGPRGSSVIETGPAEVADIDGVREYSECTDGAREYSGSVTVCTIPGDERGDSWTSVDGEFGSIDIVS
jgi:hypothetical protein